MLGDSAVGKTALIQRYLDNKFYGQYVNTLGFDFCHKQYTSKTGKCSGKSYKMQIWDTAGMERFRTLTYTYYKKADAIILAFDTTDRPTFDNVQSWITSINQHAKKGVPVILIATKIDLESDR